MVVAAPEVRDTAPWFLNVPLVETMPPVPLPASTTEPPARVSSVAPELICSVLEPLRLCDTVPATCRLPPTCSVAAVEPLLRPTSKAAPEPTSRVPLPLTVPPAQVLLEPVNTTVEP